MRKITKAERRLLVAFLGAIAILGGVTWWRVSLNTEPHVVIPPIPKAPKPNGFDLYVQAATSIVPANPSVDEAFDWPRITDPRLRAQRYSFARKEAWLKQNAKVPRLFDRALKSQSLAPAFNADEDSFSPYAKLRELARFKRIESSTRPSRGDWNGAMQSRLDALQMGDDTSRGSVLIAALVNFAIQSIARNGVRNDIKSLDARQARDAAARLEKLYGRRALLVEAMRAEKTYGLLDTLKMLRNSRWRDMDKWAQDNWFGEAPTLKDRLQVATISKQAVVDNYLEILDVVIENARLPYTATPKPLPKANNPFTRDHVGSINTRWMFARNDAANAMWLVALALHAYKLEHKSYPSELRVLEGKYLKQIPADPFGGGEILRYKRSGDNYTLWSVGPDKINNSGAPIPPDKNFSASWQKEKLPQVMPESKGDFVWGKNQ